MEPYESELVNAARELDTAQVTKSATGGKSYAADSAWRPYRQRSKTGAFGRGWYNRTFSIAAIEVVCSEKGVSDVDLVSSLAFSSRTIYSSSYSSWFVLMTEENEYLVAMNVRIDSTVIGLQFVTNRRKSEWFGKSGGTIERIEAPEGYYIHTPYGFIEDRCCQSVGAYFVPMSLQRDCRHEQLAVASKSRSVPKLFLQKEPKGDRFHLLGSFGIRALAIHLCYREWQNMMVISPSEFQRCLAASDKPLESNWIMLVLSDQELVNTVSIAVRNKRLVAIKFETTMRVTEWFGDPSYSKIETLTSLDAGTFIVGFSGIHRGGRIASISVSFAHEPSKLP